MIYVTKEQAKVIEESKYKDGVFGKISELTFIRDNTDLDLVTIACIVEGESYEVGRVFKAGDLVFSNETNEFYTVENVKGYRLTIIHHRKSGYLFEGDADSFTLVCKAENREDLANE